MTQPSDAALEFAAILGAAIARVYLAGKNANAPADDGRGVSDELDDFPNRQLEEAEA